MPAERFHGRAVDGEHVAVRGVPFILPFGVIAMVQHLHLDRAQERHSGRCDG